MIEAYKIGISLLLDSNVASETSRLSRQFEALDRTLKSVQMSVNGLAGGLRGLSRIGQSAAASWQAAAAAVAMERAASAARRAGSAMPYGGWPGGGYPQAPSGGAMARAAAGVGGGSRGALVPYAAPGGALVPGVQFGRTGAWLGGGSAAAIIPHGSPGGGGAWGGGGGNFGGFGASANGAPAGSWGIPLVWGTRFNLPKASSYDYLHVGMAAGMAGAASWLGCGAPLSRDMGRRTSSPCWAPTAASPPLG